VIKWIGIGLVAGILASSLGLNYFQNNRIVALNKKVTQLEAVKAACEQQAKIYKVWGEIDHATSEKVKKVVAGGPGAVVSALNELFGAKVPVPAAPGSAGGPGKAKPVVRVP
jgi:hypothetical protein